MKNHVEALAQKHCKGVSKKVASVKVNFISITKKQ